MKITFSSEEQRNDGQHGLKIGSRVLSIETKDALVVEVDGTTVILEGEFYYSRAEGQTTAVNAENRVDLVAKLVRQCGAANLPSVLEGTYVGCWYSSASGSAAAFVDSLNRMPFYLVQRDGNAFLSTRVADVARFSDGLDQHSLYSYLLLGYPGGQDTFYRGVQKIGPDMSIVFDRQGALPKHRPVVKKVEQFSASDLNRYDDIFSNAVAARAGSSNVVMNSGGWDSTSILYQLVQCRSKDAVSAAVFDVVLPDGQSFNTYEVDKAQRIGKYYGVETQRAVIDYRDESLVDYWQGQAENFRENNTYFWLHHLKIADMIGNSAAPGTTVFNGEASDSIHNFGFSQFVSVNYDNMQLREYADKAKSYLYSPSFFSDVLEGRHGDDKMLNFFKHYYGEEKFDSALGSDEKIRKSYFEAFMLSYPRVPFAKWQLPIATDALKASYSEHIGTTYFDDVVKNASPETLYYWLLQLYRRFHFNSYQIGVTQVALNPHGLHCAMPFLDSQMYEYMCEMPEDWGRGLELRTTKYPLRHLAEHKWNMPLHVLMEKGPHSYIAEGDRRWSYAGGSWNIYCEIMFKSVFCAYFKSVLGSAKLDHIFDAGQFNLAPIQSAIDHFVAGEERTQDVALLFRLSVLFSVGFVAYK